MEMLNQCTQNCLTNACKVALLMHEKAPIGNLLTCDSSHNSPPQGRLLIMRASQTLACVTLLMDQAMHNCIIPRRNKPNIFSLQIKSFAAFVDSATGVASIPSYRELGNISSPNALAGSKSKLNNYFPKEAKLQVSILPETTDSNIP